MCSKELPSWSVFTSFSVPIFPPLKDYPGFQLNQSCLWSEIMSALAGLQMNTIALGLLKLVAVASCRHVLRTAGKKKLGLQRPIKNTYSNWRSTVEGSSYAPSLQLHFAFRFIPIVLNLINNIKTQKKEAECVSSRWIKWYQEVVRTTRHLFTHNPLR